MVGAGAVALISIEIRLLFNVLGLVPTQPTGIILLWCVVVTLEVGHLSHNTGMIRYSPLKS